MENYFEKLVKVYRNSYEMRQRVIDRGKKVTIVYLDTVCLEEKVSNFVVKPLTELDKVEELTDISNKLSFGGYIKEEPTFDALLSDFVGGFAIVFVEGQEGAIAIDCRNAIGRSITEPPTSMVLRGPREGFVESVKTNITLLRKRLRTSSFKVKEVSIGKYTNTMVCICYLDGVANCDLVSKIEQQITSITVDGVLDSSYIARYLDPKHTLIFRRVGMTEKPDVAVGKLLEGRVAIVVDGSPMVLTLPYLYMEDLQSPGDYYDNNWLTSVSRVLRFISVLASVLLPSVYVCLQMFNYQIIPINFLVTILTATENIPFTPLTEMLMIIVIFDILREANLRMPSVVGISLSLVGAIVLGDAAVKAGLFGSPAVMIGALSGIGLFAMPDNSLILSFLRLLLTFISGVCGLYGLILALFVVLMYLTSLNNYNAPYLSPFAPSVNSDKQDGVIQEFVPLQKNRPKSFGNSNRSRRR